jgi:hypothetical protein
MSPLRQERALRLWLTHPRVERLVELVGLQEPPTRLIDRIIQPVSLIHLLLSDLL